MTLEEVDAILRSIRAPVLIPTARLGEDGRAFLQIVGAQGAGRKWMLSPHMVRSEVVRTAFMAMHAYLEHELRETFLYRGRPIFSPHVEVDALWSACEKQDRRPGSPGAWEQEPA